MAVADEWCLLPASLHFRNEMKQLKTGEDKDVERFEGRKQRGFKAQGKITHESQGDIGKVYAAPPFSCDRHSQDAIAFFAKHGDQSDLQVIHCVAAHVEEGQFRPYDLVVVDEKDKGNEYFMISPKGIVHICPGKQSEHTTLTSWLLGSPNRQNAPALTMSELPSFKWLIFGCGGVGGYFGARIAQVKGQRVSYIVRNKALAALKEHGVRITSICGDVQVPPSELGPILDSQALDKEEKFVADVIMLGCKAWEAKDCLQMCEPWCGPETLVLPLQNGVEGLSTIRDIVTSWGKGHALAGCCNIVSAIAEPGHIKHWAANPPYITFGEFLGAATPKTLQVKAILDAAPGMDGNLEEDALAKIWEKFTFICSTTSVQAITGPHATQDMIPAIPELLDTWRAAMHEIVALCHSYGIKYDLKQVDQRVEALRVAKGASTSCSRDLWSGKPSEVDDLLGSVVRMSKEQKVPVPTISACYSALIVRDRIARGQELPIQVPEGQKILGPNWGPA
ncbi:Uncharacterized oxidoreductase YkpB [Durusdinium trenchii]|uniref:Uncharacterized oxidoreductase YkpB n=1 Tax=Durusdinium trenchii TaxID=1381693 RepID=A0ABP0QUJ5_9DINO